MFALAAFSRRASTMTVPAAAFSTQALSTFSRRAPAMFARQGLTAAPVATFSTQSHMQVEALEETLKSMHWTDVKDNVHEIRELMNELKTNHALHKPDAGFEGHVADAMQEIQNMIGESAPSKEEIADRVFGLKREVKGKLYYA